MVVGAEKGGAAGTPPAGSGGSRLTSVRGSRATGSSCSFAARAPGGFFALTLHISQKACTVTSQQHGGWSRVGMPGTLAACSLSTVAGSVNRRAEELEAPGVPVPPPDTELGGDGVACKGAFRLEVAAEGDEGEVAGFCEVPPARHDDGAHPPRHAVGAPPGRKPCNPLEPR